MLAAISAAEPAMESAEHFWRLPLPEGWSELTLTPVMQGRVRAQAMADGPDGRAMLITVRPDGRASPAIDQVFVTGFIDSFIMAAREQGLDHTRAGVTMIEWDGLPAGEVTATVKEGSEVHAVIFRVLAANGFVYQVRALQQNAAAVDADLRAVLESFRLTRKPEPVVADPAASALDVPASDESGAPGASQTSDAAAPAKPGPNPLLIIGGIAGTAIVLVLGAALIFRKRPGRARSTGRHRRQREPTARDELGIVPPPPKRPASQRTTARIPQAPSSQRPTEVTPPNRRTTVLMPQQPGTDSTPAGAPPKGNDANVRRRRTNS